MSLLLKKIFDVSVAVNRVSLLFVNSGWYDVVTEAMQRLESGETPTRIHGGAPTVRKDVYEWTLEESLSGRKIRLKIHMTDTTFEIKYPKQKNGGRNTSYHYLSVPREEFKQAMMQAALEAK